MSEKKFEDHLDEAYMVDLLLRLLKVDCTVELGPETLMEPDHPKLVNYVQNVIRPELQNIGAHHIIDLPKNQLGVRIGKGVSGKALLVMAYTPVQHHNWMKKPLDARIAVPTEYGVNEPCAWGQGASQNKAHFTSMITLLKAFIDSGDEPEGVLYFVANNEGRSSHECSTALIPELNPKPDYGVILIGGNNRLSVANRGRVDVLVHVEGKVTHSSNPESGLNAIEGAVEVLNRIKQMKFTKTHPQLGGQHAIPYQLTFDPVAPHTLPCYARIKVDRRLLPGDSPDEAVEEVRKAIGDMSPYKVRVEGDVVMLPSVVEEDSPIVQSIQKAIRSIDGKDAELMYGKGAYDAGGPTSLGVPTVMYGRPLCNSSVMGDDYVSLRGVKEEALILGWMIKDILS